MYIEFKRTKSLMTARMWQEFFEGEGVPTRILPAATGQGEEATGGYRILVPQDKEHVLEEILRKL